MRKKIIEKVAAENISLYSIAKETKLMYNTVWRYINTNYSYSSTTEELIAKYLGLWEQ